MRHPIALLLALVLAGCGTDARKSPAPAPASPEAAAKARLEAVFATARAGDASRLAPFVVYRGADEARRYKDAARYEGAEARQVDHVFARVRRHLDAGAPVFGPSEARTKGSESWVAWTITFGEGEQAAKTLYALVKVGETWLLGDIDGA